MFQGGNHGQILRHLWFRIGPTSGEVLLAAAAGGRCTRCGYDVNHAALVWHHIEPAQKRFEVDIRAMSNRSVAELESEIAKCRLLCQNCHMEVHHPDARLT